MRLIVGRLGRAHGIRGEVTVEVRTDVPEQRFVPGGEFVAVAAARGPRAAAAEERRLVLEGARDHNGVWLLAFEGVHDRTAAEALRNLVLEIDAPDSSEEEDAWYDHELVGLSVEDSDGRPRGKVVAVEHPGAQDLLVVRCEDGVRRYVPFVAALVPVVDVRAGRVVVADPGGLLSDLDDADGAEG